MSGAARLAVAAIIVAAAAFGCDRERTFPEPRVSAPEEKTNLPAINERIEREAEQGTGTGTPPAPQPGTDATPSPAQR